MAFFGAVNSLISYPVLHILMCIEKKNHYESETGKDELKSKIQTLIGQDNGTISIGQENQSTLSLKSLGLAPGNYLLFAGAYEKENGLAGMAQEKLTISPARKEDPDSKSYSGDYNFSGITSKGQSFLLSVI